MSTFSRYSLIACITLLANNAWAGLNPVPGPEFGEGSIGLLALGISAVAYLAYKYKNKK
ncbi:MAG: hypothetical protein IPI14_02485 [Polaromonas sp.]|jgi:hypothetical protein|nr:hypothetical protein [Polaromonas sp.]MBL0252490.1 hypothetical protein [Polaromonas sp.]